MALTRSRPPPLRPEEPELEIDHNVDGRLCIICETLEIDKYFFNSITRPIKLGSWSQIVRSQASCNFCRLVVHCLAADHRRVEPDGRNQILLSNYPSWELGVEMSPYDRLKSEAYSNKFDLRSRAKRCSATAYRLIVYLKDAPAICGCIQYLADGEFNDDNRQFFGRAMDADRVDIILLREWLARCERHHGGSCEEDGIAGRRLPQNLRLIDVQNRTIVRAPGTKGLRYLTLSYVWGRREMEETGLGVAVLKRADIRTTPAGVENTPLPENLPQTIEDAISLTNSLGLRYLWVDALCIVQDDGIEDKRIHLRRMDAVYNCSTLTIAAASGRHANLGIPGISRPRRSQFSEAVKGVPLAVMSPSFTELENSEYLVWNTRGWTFQEKVLSKRLLLFTDFQVYFRCSEAVWTEEIVMETGRLSKSIQSRPGKYRWAADRPAAVETPRLRMLKLVMPELNLDDQWKYLGKFPDYVAAVREYTHRSLSDPDDTLIAIDGVFRTLRPDTGRFIRGLPEGYFLPSLLWYPEPGSIHRRSLANMPSWTWAGWTSSKGVSSDVLDIRLLRTVIIAIRNLFIRLGKILGKIMSNMGQSDSPSSTSSSSDPISSSSYDNTSSSSYDNTSSSSSAPTPFSELLPFKKRDWSTRSIVGKATVNMASCFGWPLLVRDHTIRDIYLCDDGVVSKLECRETLALSTFLEEDITAPDQSNSHRERPKEAGHYPSRKSLKYRFPFLSMKTIVTRFAIGECLHDHPPIDLDEASIYELLDPQGRCVGEVWTTRRHAEHGSAQPLDFITVSWGLSLSAAEVAEEYVPRWTFNSARLPESQTFMDYFPIIQNAFQYSSTKTLAGRYGQHPRGIKTPSLMNFVEALLTAEKGEPRPKFLWSTVNLILVEWDGPVARRIGVGRVVFNAWLLARSPAEEIILA